MLGMVAPLRQRLLRFGPRRYERLFTTRAVEPGELLVVQGDPGDTFWWLFEGRAIVERDRMPIGSVRPGEFWGELALLPTIAGTGGRRRASVTITEPGVVGHMNRADFERLLIDFPQVGGRILAQAHRITGW